jgi:hypothetical protein
MPPTPKPEKMLLLSGSKPLASAGKTGYTLHMFVPDSLIIAILVALGTLTGVVAVLVLFIRRHRRAVNQALAENYAAYCKTAQQLAEAIAATQRQQGHYDQQTQNLAQALLRLRQDLQRGQPRPATAAKKEAEAADELPPLVRILH